MPRSTAPRPPRRAFRATPLVLAAALALAGCGAEETPDVQGAGDDDVAAVEPGEAESDATAQDEGSEPEASEDEVAGEEAANDPAEVGANELGQIPVLMYHRLLDSGGGEYDLTPEEFRAELEWLYAHDFRPVRMADVAAGEIDLPAGMSPVVLTFDDSTREQFALTGDGAVAPDTKVGILEEFGDRHDDWDTTAASFYVITSSLFGGGDRADDLLRELSERGYEVGNHTHTHANLRQLSDGEVQEELAEAARRIEEVTGTVSTTLSLPFGVRPQDPALAGAGEADGSAYEHTASLLVGSGPASSPFHAEWDGLAVPRIRSSPSWEGGEPDWGSAFWLQWLLGDEQRRYVSDGDPDTISFPADLADQLDPAHEDRANPY